jgi:hypothetical protein
VYGVQCVAYCKRDFGFRWIEFEGGIGGSQHAGANQRQDEVSHDAIKI